MSRMRTKIAAVLAVAGLTLMGCGRSGDKPPPLAQSPPPPEQTREQFIAKTDAQCKASNIRTRALNRELQRAAAGAVDNEQLLQRLAPILAKGYEPVRENAAAFRAATPPAADAAAVEKIRTVYDEQPELVRELADAAKRGDTARYDAVSEEQAALVTKARRLARDYGFKECGSAKSDVKPETEPPREQPARTEAPQPYGS
jgi:hypothetical protein